MIGSSATAQAAQAEQKPVHIISGQSLEEDLKTILFEILL